MQKNTPFQKRDSFQESVSRSGTRQLLAARQFGEESVFVGSGGRYAPPYGLDVFTTSEHSNSPGR